jgi:hypothetical protein
MTIKNYLSAILLLSVSGVLKSQEKDTISIKPTKVYVIPPLCYPETRSAVVSVNPSTSRQQINPSFNKPVDFLDNLDISGYYRFIANYREMQTVYSHLETNKNNLFVGDDSQIPQLMLNLKGYAGSNTFFGTDLFMWTPLTGAGQIENVKGLNLGISLYGSFTTALGNFTVRTGGINWYAMSPFTFQTNKGYNRYSLFERNPWDPQTAKVESRYSEFYTSGAINQDQRWGNQAFHGLIIEGAQLPRNYSFSALVGKTQFDGGMSALPNTSAGGRLQKSYKGENGWIALNTFNNESLVDSLKSIKTGFNMVTAEWKHQFKHFKIYSELGAGKKFVNSNQGKWGEALSVKVSGDILKKFATEFHIYRVSPNVFNNSSIFINSSIQQTVQATAGQTQPVLIPVSSAVLPIGQLSNNRQGIEINSQINFGRLKNSVGYAISGEMEALSPKLTYTHAFNNLALSRFWRWDFPSGVGPYANLNKIYRSVFESVNMSELDANGKPLYKKYFNTIELNSKYKTRLGRKEMYLFYLGSLNSVQNFAAPTVVFGERALLRAYYHQAESYLKLNPNLVLTTYASFERILGNYQTQTDTETRRPKNQTGYSIATGFDLQMGKGVGLYVRERWMKYKDTSFTKDQYEGFETTVELKAFF